MEDEPGEAHCAARVVCAATAIKKNSVSDSAKKSEMLLKYLAAQGNR